MNVVIFSQNGTHYSDSKKGDITAIFVPFREKIRSFSDMTNINKSEVRQRYGDMDGQPLYRDKGGMVEVYGELQTELAERREGVEIYLPQDFVPESCRAFYMVFGERWMAHGVKSFTEEGKGVWEVSLVDAEMRGPVDTIVSSLSDRMLSSDLGPDNVLISVHGSQEILTSLQNELEPLEYQVYRFDTLVAQKDSPPLYQHKDYGLMMLTVVMLAVFILAGTSAYLIRNTVKLSKIEQEIVQLQEEIQNVQTNKRLGHIDNPRQVLDAMAKPIKQQPSAIIHSVGEVASVFGELREITLQSTGNQSREKGQMVVEAGVFNPKNDLWVDQERIAKASFASRPWVRKIVRGQGSKSGLGLKIWVQVE